MFSFVDYRGDKKRKLCIPDNSMMGYIRNHPNLTKFHKIVKKANMVGQLSNQSANFTIFVPLDEHLKYLPDEFFDKMDDGTARQIMYASTLNRVIDGYLIRSSPVSYFATRGSPSGSTDSFNRMYITNINGVATINQCVNVVKYDIALDNGMIHLTNGIIGPTDNTYIN